MVQIYLCRHGETEWSRSGQHTGKTDIPLTPHGLEEAVQLRAKLGTIHFSKVLSSPKVRALATCEGMHPEIERLAVEWDYGDYEGLTSTQIHAKDPHWDLFRDGAPHGESPEQVGKRADQLLEKIKSSKGKIAIFSHGHFLRVFTARFLGLEPDKARLFALSVASLSILSYERDQPIILLWNS